MKSNHILVTGLTGIILLWLSACTGGSLKTKVDGSYSKDEAAAEATEAVAERAPEESVSVDEAEVDTEGNGQNARTESAGLLTAGEWNDIDNWDFWENLMKDKNWSGMQKHWGFYTLEKFMVQVKEASGKNAENIKAELIDDSGDVLWTAKTDVFGKAILFPSLFKPHQGTYSLKLTDKNGKEQIFSDLKKNELNELSFKGQSSAKNIMDIMFVTDATGSMGDELSFLQAELSDIAGKISEKAPAMTIRVSNIFYRDRGDDYVVRDFDFSTDINKVQSDVNAQSASGGGDYEEAVETALYSAVKKQSWSPDAKTRLMFLILDAPPHQTPGNIKKMQRSVQLAAEQGIKIIPISASGIEKNTEFLMRFFSVATNGTYTFLTDDSGIGNPHLKPTTGKYEVEYLNDLMIRLILKYAGIRYHRPTS